MTEASVKAADQADDSPDGALRRAFERGEELDLSERAGRRVAADVLASILTAPVNAAPGRVAKLRLAGAVITGRLDLDGAEITHGVNFRSCRFEQAIMLNDARMRALCLEECAFTELNAQMTRFDGNLVIGNCAASMLDLLGARVDGILALSGSHVEGTGGIAVQADGIAVERDLFARQKFRAEGRMQLPGAAIRGDLDLSSATLAMPDDRNIGLDLQAAHIGGHLKLGPDFNIKGSTQLNYCAVDGQIRVERAKFKSRGDSVVSADRIAIGTDLFFASESDCEGNFRLHGARAAAGRIDLELLRLNGSSGLDCEEAEALLLHLPPGNGVGTLTLNNAHVGVLKGWRAPWPEKMLISGLTYDSLDPIPDVSAQVELLKQGAAGYEPQPYEQLASAYRRSGRDADARTVLLAKQRHRRDGQAPILKAWGYLQDWTVGYGYSPVRAAVWLVALALIGTVAFAVKHPPPLKPEAPEFNPVLYTLDLLLPIISFGQEGAFNPGSAQQWLAAGLVIAGWVLATTIVAGITRVLSRQ
jgi:hypothetical protein